DDRDALCDRIGCSVPYLQQGNVRLQVMAFYTPVVPDAAEASFALTQSQLYRDMPKRYGNQLVPLQPGQTMHELEQNNQVGMLAAIENATGFCGENESLDQGFKNLEQIIENCGRLFYISLTHAGENRFGGGNGTEPGIKPDGEEMLRYLSGRNICIDLAHTSDALAHDILTCIAQKSLDLKVIATHSNFRTVHGHIRNLPDELAQEVIHRKGLIGMNFLKHMIGTKNHHDLHDHIRYGLDNGAEDSICFGADFFYAAAVASGEQQPYFYDEHRTAACYPKVLQEMQEYMTDEQVMKLSYGNVMRFLERL
ncbi:MAG: peptidase, partial [Sphingobacteriales bacterium]